jgi:hypothetical protein
VLYHENATAQGVEPAPLDLLEEAAGIQEV